MRPIGFVGALAAIALASAIVAMLLFEASATGELAVVPIAIFALTALASAVLGVRVYRSISPAPSASSRIGSPAASIQTSRPASAPHS